VASAEEPRLLLAEFIVGLSLVADLGMGLEPGDAARSCLVATRLADQLNLPGPAETYYTSLLQHCGCTAFSHEAAELFAGDDLAAKHAAVRTNFASPREIVGTYLLGLAPDAGPVGRLRSIGSAVGRSAQVTAGYSRANCEVASAIARRVGLGRGVEQGLIQIFEQWNGRGHPRGLAGDDISPAARCAQVAGIAALFDRLGGVEAAVAAVRARSGSSLDPEIVDGYVRVAREVHSELAGVDPLRAAVEAEPGPVAQASPVQLDGVCRAFGDAVDLKSLWFHGHSAGVSALAERAGQVLRMSLDDVTRLRRAGHLADIGRAGVATGIWEKERTLTTGDWERVRLHAYHSERILGRCPPLAGLAALAGMHHERLDGSGYHRATTAVPMLARVLGAADTFHAMISDRPHRPAAPPDRAASALRAEGRAGRLDPEAVEAVLTAAGQRAARPARPDGLTERQVEVLRLVASGLSNPQIAERLVVSRRTAEHHVQDIYSRIGMSSRAGAALYAMEHGLL
jgi:HD-GYP domain-containing protein (c-di-GMP phosphodiesterase class II)